MSARLCVLLCIGLIIVGLSAQEENRNKNDKAVKESSEEIDDLSAGSIRDESDEEDFELADGPELANGHEEAPSELVSYVEGDELSSAAFKEESSEVDDTDSFIIGTESDIHAMCPIYTHYIYHGGKEGQVYLDCGYQSSFINASVYAVCDIKTESFNIMDLPMCPAMKSFIVLTTNDTATVDVEQPWGYAVGVPDIEASRDSVELYLRNHPWVLAVDDGVKIVCGNALYAIKEGQISRCFGAILDHNPFVYAFGRFILGKRGQTFYYYPFVNNEDLSDDQKLVADIVMDPEAVTFGKTWYICATEGFFINCGGITNGSIFDHTLLKQEWQFIERTHYARCSGTNILIDMPRYGDTVWIIRAGLYVQGREKIVLENFVEPSFDYQTYVTAKDNMQIKCGSYHYYPRPNEILSCNLLHILRTGEKLNIIEGIEGVTYYFPLEMYMPDAEDFYENPAEQYVSYDILNAGDWFGVKEKSEYQFIRAELPSAALNAFKNASFKSLEDENLAIRKYFANDEIFWLQH